jgi:hypothetical protein
VVASGATLVIKEDASPLDRKELLVVISYLVKGWGGEVILSFESGSIGRKTERKGWRD